jgi:signal recognition particle subunit SRP54
MGDILSLVEKAQEKLDSKKSEEFAKKALSGDGFSLEDFREQLRQIKKLGSLQSIVKMLPSVGPFAGIQNMADKVDDKELNRVEAIISSMTAYERDHHEAINGSRRKRIARGSGTSVQEVNQLLKQYAMMKKQFKSLSKGGGFSRKLAGMRFR